MAEIAALTAARASALAGDAERLRDQQEQARARRDLERQQELEAQNRAAAEQRAADQRRLQVLRDERRVAGENRRFFLDQQELLQSDILDERFFFTQAQIEADNLDARALRDREDSALPPAAPAGRDFEPVAAPAIESPAGPDQGRDLNFQALEDARDARLAERREAARDALLQQRLDLQDAADRIATTPPNPDLPRGSIVDVVG